MFKKQTKDILIQQGDDIEVVFEVTDEAETPIDLTSGYTAKMQARTAVSDKDPLFSFANGTGLTLQNGSIKATFPHATTAAFTFEKAEYDLEIATNPGGLVTTVYRGTITLRKEITR